MRVLVLVLMMLLAGCFDPTIDTSSMAAYKASVEKVKASLAEADRERFEAALKELVMGGMDLATLMAVGSNPESAMNMPQIKELGGLSGAEIIARGEAKIAARKAKEREQALAEIAELEAKQQVAESAKTELLKFKVLSSRFSRECDSRYCFRKEPIVELKVKNGTDHAISRAYFRGTVASPDRSVPWIVEEFSYQISGGLEPGEEAAWRLAPNAYSGDWNTETPEDAVMTVEVLQIDGADGEALFSARGLSESEAKRLAKLKAAF